MGEAERERRHCFLLYKLPEEEKPKKSNAIYAVETVPKTPLTDNELELANKPEDKKHYVQSIYVTGDQEEVYAKKLDSKSAVYHLEFDENSQHPNTALSLHGSIAQLPRQEIVTTNNHHAAENSTHQFFSHKYAPFILRDSVRMIASICYVVYLVIAIFGCLNFREGLEPKNLVTHSHYIASYFDDMKLFWKIGPQLHVAVLTPPNFADPIQR